MTQKQLSESESKPKHKSSPAQALKKTVLTDMPINQTKKGMARQQKILQVAEQTFMQHGYAGTSVNEIVRVSGGSLGTLYRVFGNKLGLFEAVFKRKSKALFGPFEEVSYWGETLEKSLYRFGSALQNVALSADGIAIYRLVVTEHNMDQSEIQTIFYKYGPQMANQMLGEYLEKQHQQGFIEVNDCKLAAAQFIEMIKGPFMNRMLFGESIAKEELEQALRQAISIFLSGIVVRQPQ